MSDDYDFDGDVEFEWDGEMTGPSMNSDGTHSHSSFQYNSHLPDTHEFYEDLDASYPPDEEDEYYKDAEQKQRKPKTFWDWLFGNDKDDEEDNDPGPDKSEIPPEFQ